MCVPLVSEPPHDASSAQVYVEGYLGEVVLMDSTDSGGGTLALGGGYGTEVDPAGYTAVTIHPDGTVREKPIEK